MSLIHCKIHHKLNWTKNSTGNTELKITTLYVPIVTLSTENYIKLTKQLNKGFKGSVYWNEYKTKIEPKYLDNKNPIRICPDASFQGVKRLFVLAFDSSNNADKKFERNSHRKYFVPKVNITNYNVLIDGRNFYDQPIGDQIKKYDEIRKITTGHVDDYTTGCLLDCQYFKDHYDLIQSILAKKKKELDGDQKTIQQLEFYGMIDTSSQVCTILEKLKQTVLEFYKGRTKVL